MVYITIVVYGALLVDGGEYVVRFRRVANNYYYYRQTPAVETSAWSLLKRSDWPGWCSGEYGNRPFWKIK